jgi:4-hydroxybenzoate polyprenyltransferase
MQQSDFTPASSNFAAVQVNVLFVDLENGLLSNDAGWEVIVDAVKHDPWMSLHVPHWAFRGDVAIPKSLWQSYLSRRDLPLRQSVVELIRQRRATGWQIVLVTSGSAPVAQSLIDKSGLFDDLITASAATRSDYLREYCRVRGCEAFSVITGRSDLPLLTSAAETILVAPSAATESTVRRGGYTVKVIDAEDKRNGSGIALLRAIRPHHWVKNLLVFAPVIFHHSFSDALPWLQSGLAFLLFCLVCSGVYVLNDLLDMPSDRRHPVKFRRPFAAGTLRVRTGLITSAGLLLVAGVLAVALLPLEFAGVLATYVGLNVLYTTWLKRKVMIDILVLASFYSLRMVAGGAATGIVLSEWLIAMSMFLFLSLAFLKRHGELIRLREEGLARTDNRGYQVQDLEMIETLGATSGYMAVLVLALYINGDFVVGLYSHPRVLWLVCLVLLYWISRVWIWARRGVLAEDPLMFALKDRVSWVALALMVFLAAIAL